MKKALSHLDRRGRAQMVDVGAKPRTKRDAVATASVLLKPETLMLIREGNVPKGDVASAARIAGIMAAKKTPELVPLCHPVPLTSVEVDVTLNDAEGRVEITSRARCTGQTGVEMEALTAAAVAALTVYDMVKAVDRGAVVGGIMLLEKKGGRSGHYRRKSK
jgi:cyclic pyranopterin phosphate synthase